MQEGETPNAIARDYEVSLQQLLALNELTRSGDLLRVGQELLIGPEEPAERPVHCAVYDPVIHVVQPGDNLFTIAWTYGIPAEYIYIRNQLSEGGRHLLVGQEIVIPGATWPDRPEGPVPEECVDDTPLTHVVQEGQTLGAIALAHGVDVQRILENNRLSNENLIFVGQVLDLRDLPETGRESTPTGNG